MSAFSLKSLTITIFIACLACSSRFQTCSARKTKYTKQFKNIGKEYVGYSYHDNKFIDGSNRVTTPLKNAGSSIFNVLDFGAKGDGKTDDTKAFEAAWAAACQVQGSTMMVPSGSLFLIKPVTFSGPNCKSNIVFQLDGKIIAPTSSSAWGSGLLQWLDFSKLQGITIRGKGTIDGQGTVWWHDSTEESESETPTTGDSFYGGNQDSISGELSSKMPSTKPTALRFYGSSDVTVTGITIQNSPQTHLKFDDCIGVHVSDVSVSSPGNSPNTDGIHSFYHLALQGGSGSVSGVMFSNIQVSEVQTPIMIDQFYCDKSRCENETSAVAISDINFVNIKGTYTEKPVHFACSDSLPCSGVTLTTIQLKPAQAASQLDAPYCWETYGELKTSTIPPINCLQTGKPSKNKLHSNGDSC